MSMEGNADPALAARQYLEQCTDTSTAAVPRERPPKALPVPRRWRPGESDEAERLLADELLLRSLSALPQNYDFEIAKTVERIRRDRIQSVALQLPEGLQVYACTLADILQRLCQTKGSHTCLKVVILAEVTYGACCVDDLAAQRCGCELLIHYGHSCLVPIQHACVRTMYIFVRVSFETEHLIQCIMKEFEERSERIRLYLVSTIQFQGLLGTVAKALRERGRFSEIFIPQARPLSRGELLGCTAPMVSTEHEAQETVPSIGDSWAVLYIGDGRFHLESVMIQNAHVEAFYRYDPYGKTLTREFYDHDSMVRERWEAIEAARRPNVRLWGVILGTLGRQGNLNILRRILGMLREDCKQYVAILCNEVTPEKLRLLSGSGIDVWVQVACPRLSIDWGRNLAPDGAPVLTPYEAMVAVGRVPWRGRRYPMDYYAGSGGPWSNYYRDGS
jgi:2-(3-amino-3-carboxypropyl)histidine synthase